MPGKPYIDGKSISQRLDDIGIDEICEQIANCVPLRVIAANEGISKGSLINWLAEHSEQYSRARDAQQIRWLKICWQLPMIGQTIRTKMKTVRKPITMSLPGHGYA